MILAYNKEGMVYTTPCPFGKKCMIGSANCSNCVNFEGAVMGERSIRCSFELRWRKAKAGKNFGKDTIVLYNGDPDARLVRCAVYDCIYIHVEDLLKLPKE